MAAFASTFARESALPPLLLRKRTMRLKRLTPQAFEQIAADTRMGDQARQMARAVLVDGRTQVDVAAEYGFSKQRVSLAVSSIERAYKKTSAPGVNFIRVELDLPEELALELAVFSDALRRHADVSQASEALEKTVGAVRRASNRLKTMQSTTPA